MMNAFEMAHYSDWEGITESAHGFILEQWAAQGVKNLIFTSSMMAQSVADKDFFDRLKARVAVHGLHLADGHSPWNEHWALNTPEPFREIMIANNTKALQIAGENGSRTLTIHIGNNVCFSKVPIKLEQLRDLLDDALDRLIPVAERCNIVLCIENIMAPTDTPAELLRCFKKFQSPFFGCCFDSGHANVMCDPHNEKDLGKLCSWLPTLWQNAPQFYHGDALKVLLPYIVTCHLHDNNGYDDQHLPPGHGTVNWQYVRKLLQIAPRLQSLQDEVHINSGFSIREMVESFVHVGF